MTGQPAQATYYDRPLLKPTVWTWMIPAYFFVGGIAGASMALGGMAQVLGGRAMRPFAARCFLIGTCSGSVGSVLLIADLGKPSRFLNMLRVFRRTSPMSVGSWILSSATACSTAAVLLPGAAGEFAGYGAALFGVPLSGYTAVLLANTAVPVWQESRKSMPVLFTASAMASAGAILKLIPACGKDHRIANTFAVTGGLIEFAAAHAMERECARVPLVANALHRGVPGVLWNTAKLLTAGSLVLSMWSGRRRRIRIASGVLGAAGSLCLRFAVFEAGKSSARDPRAVSQQQRDRLQGVSREGILNL